MEYPKIELVTTALDKKGIMTLKEKRLITNIRLSDLRVQTRADGFLAERAFFLPTNYDWVIGRDDMDYLCLIPLKLKS